MATETIGMRKFVSGADVAIRDSGDFPKHVENKFANKIQ
jgi:hypothetical protein